MILNSQQRDAVVKVIDWYFTGDLENRPIYTLTGVAGSGKSSIIPTIISVLGLNTYNVLFTAYTGKAVSVLRMKGMTANTIHKQFYNIYRSSRGSFSFTPKSSLPSLIKLIVIDEFSMINDKMIDDIESFGIPIIALGDPVQLPPVIGRNTIMEDVDNLDTILTKVMRQDDSSGILDLATMSRNNEVIPFGKYKDCNVFHLSDIKDLTKYDVILCWKNSTRRTFNRIIRDKLGLTSIYPQKNEKLLCLKTNYFNEIEYDNIQIFPVNGMELISIDSHYNITDNNFSLRFKPSFIESNNIYFDTECSKICFDHYLKDIQKDPVLVDENNTEDRSILFDWGYAVSVHKSQGSQWNRVLILDEFKGPGDVYRKWLYTAITRAQKSCDIVKLD